MEIVDHPGREPATDLSGSISLTNDFFSQLKPREFVFIGLGSCASVKLLIPGQNHAIHLDRIEPSTDDATRRTLSEKTEGPAFWAIWGRDWYGPSGSLCAQRPTSEWH